MSLEILRCELPPFLVERLSLMVSGNCKSYIEGRFFILSLQFLTATCGGTYIGQRGMIHSPGFPGNYPDSSICEWYLEGPTGHYLTLSYGNFSLQAAPGCSADYVEVREYNASGEKTRGWVQLLFLCLNQHNQYTMH